MAKRRTPEKPTPVYHSMRRLLRGTLRRILRARAVNSHLGLPGTTRAPGALPRDPDSPDDT